MGEKRKSLRRSNRRRGRGTRRSGAPTKSQLFEWSSIFPKASIKSNTRFNLKNDWGLKVKGVLNV
jgi:hypothetical protein